MIRAVLDANVFVSAALSPAGTPARVLAAWRAETFALVTSPAILTEIERVLQYPKIARRHGWPPARIREVVGELAHFSISTPGELTLAVVAADPADNRYLECAVEGAAEYLVSGDEHLLSLEEYQGIRLVRPREFLRVLAGPPRR